MALDIDEGEIFKSPVCDELFEVVDTPDSFGNTTYEAEYQTITIECLSDGMILREPRDKFGGTGYTKVADSKDDL